MPRIEIVSEGQVLSEWVLEGREVTVGRGSDCDIQLNDPSVSRKHARLGRIYTDYFVEDLHSTNGLTLNGRRVRKHMLKDGDVLHIGSHEIKFIDPEAEGGTDLDKTVVLRRTSAERQRVVASPLASEAAGRAYVHYLSGPEQGNSRTVDKSLFTIGQPGGNLAVISRRAQGYFLLHLGGPSPTTVNGNVVHGGGVPLNSGDAIDVGDIRLEFFREP